MDIYLDDENSKVKKIANKIVDYMKTLQIKNHTP
jgi:hypothetical protein